MYVPSSMVIGFHRNNLEAVKAGITDRRDMLSMALM
jgi:hypothetical protein